MSDVLAIGATLKARRAAFAGELAGVRRALAQKAAQSAGRRAYAAGAQMSRLTQDWVMSAASIDQEVRADLRILRRRARALVRDNAYAGAVPREVAQNVIGEDGIRIHARNRAGNAKTGELAASANAAIKDAWEDWSHFETASVDRMQSWVEQQRAILESVVTDGEAFVRLWPGFRNEYGFALQLIDPDMVDEQFNRGADQDGNEIRMGVEVDRFGAPVAYHVWTRHPSEPGPRERVAIPASEIRHLFIRRRIGQTRGLSWFSPVLLPLQMLGGYEEAELVAARTAAAKMGFFQTTGDNADGIDPNADHDQRLTMDAAPGTFEQLPPGFEFKEWNPQHPSTAFAGFVSAILRSAARGVGMSYISLTGDLSNANYSSARVGLLPERDLYRILQKWVAEHLHRPVYRAWLQVALLTPKLALPSRDPARWMAVEWRGRGWKWIDPSNELQALENEIRLGINSRTRACAERGVDFEQVLEDLSNEEALAAAYGVDISGINFVGYQKEPGSAVPGSDEDAPSATPKPAAGDGAADGAAAGESDGAKHHAPHTTRARGVAQLRRLPVARPA